MSRSVHLITFRTINPLFQGIFLKGTKITGDAYPHENHFLVMERRKWISNLIMALMRCPGEEWDQTYGKVHTSLIDEGVMTVMAGHIALPAYSRKFKTWHQGMWISVRQTLAPELITDLLKGQLGFNGLVVTDASHMIGTFGATVPRRK